MEGSMRLGILFSVVIAFSPARAVAAPVVVAGFTFSAGEEAFADYAELVSGSIRLCGATNSIASALTGSDLLD